MFGLSVGVTIFIGLLYLSSTAIFSAWLASIKGYSGKTWFFLGLFFGLIAFFAIGFAPKIKRQNTVEEKVDDKQNILESLGYETYEIKNRTKLFEEPNNKSKIVCDLLVGETIALVDKKEVDNKNWHKIKDKENNEGWCILNISD
jgi:hypothetical protein